MFFRVWFFAAEGPPMSHGALPEALVTCLYATLTEPDTTKTGRGDAADRLSAVAEFSAHVLRLGHRASARRQCSGGSRTLCVVEPDHRRRSGRGLGGGADRARSTLESAGGLDTLFVCAGGNPASFDHKPSFRGCGRCARRRSVAIGGMSGGAYILARAGLLERRRCTRTRGSIFRHWLRNFPICGWSARSMCSTATASPAPENSPPST